MNINTFVIHLIGETVNRVEQFGIDDGRVGGRTERECLECYVT